MGCEHKESGGFYHPRQPRQTPFYQLVERFYPQFEAAYEERFQERYGFWRPIIGTVVEKFLECGDLQQGFARVRCPDCTHEFFVAYSCRGRCFCPSCLPAKASAQAGHQKRALQTALWVSQEICASVPHRQFVFTIPKRLRIYFRFDRRLLGELCRTAWKVVLAVYQASSDHPDAVAGMIGAIQTFRDLIHWHPHIHALVSEGVFLADGTFVPLPKLATEPFLKLWEQEVFQLLLAEGKITEGDRRQHPQLATLPPTPKGFGGQAGFSVDQSVRVEVEDTEGLQRLIEYFRPASRFSRIARQDSPLGLPPRPPKG